MVGVALFAAASAQQIGIVTTTAGKAGFITGLYVVLVPLVALVWGERTSWITWFGALMATAGLYYLSVTEALTRLQNGERGLAIHPGCGTNLATTVGLAGTFAWIPLRGRKSTLGRLALVPLALLFAALGFALARQLGPALQQHVTTEADLGDLQISEIRFIRKGVHRVITK